MPPSIRSFFDLMNEEEQDQRQHDQQKERRQRRKELLGPTGVKDLFKEGKISINKFTCVGIQCRLCIKACPTNALYWGSNGIGVIDDLCVYCGACVLNCMVDDCIKVERTRSDGKVERYGRASDVVKMVERLNGTKRFERVRANAAAKRRTNKEDRAKQYRNQRHLYVDNEYQI